MPLNLQKSSHLGQQPKDHAALLYRRALDQASIRAAFARTVHVSEATLSVGEQQWPFADFQEIYVVAIGKAAAELYEASLPLLERFSQAHAVVDGPRPPTRHIGQLTYFQGGHPVPNTDSFRAGAAVLDLLGRAGAHTFVLFLISGGGSSMLEAPLDPALTPQDFTVLNTALIGSGGSIAQINTVRKRLSAVKGGRLAAAANGATQLSLLVSDVPANAPDALASGPTLPDTSTNADCERILRDYLRPSDLPPSLQHALAGPFAETPKPGDAAFAHSTDAVLLDNSTLVDLAAQAARELGYEPVIDNTCDDWDYADAADYLLHRFDQLRQQHPRPCLLSGGELTVRLPIHPGLGGRNQQWALACAQKLANSRQPVTVLSAGSDGIDGNSPAAGAVADENTWRRARELGLDPALHLNSFNAFPLFQALGDALITGPSGNNLRDLRILLPSR